MRVLLAFGCLFALIAMPVAAQAPSPPAAELGTQAAQSAKPPAGRSQQPAGTPLEPVDDPAAHAKRLGDLFMRLKQEPTAAKAESIAAQINAEWLESGSATVDLLVQRAGTAIGKNDNAAAFDFLDQAIILDPNYAEAWNRRATLNYSTANYGKSLDDIRVTLRLEPRHYGALMGLASILEETGRKPQALEAYGKVLELYPTLKAAQDAVGRLSDELAGQAL